MDCTIVNRDELYRYGDTYEFEGYKHGDANISLILIDMPSGHGTRLHSHPYEEVFVVQEGKALFTVGTKTLEVQAGQIVIVPPGVPHKFVNSGETPLRQIDIHASRKMITTWLEDEPTS